MVFSLSDDSSVIVVPWSLVLSHPRQSCSDGASVGPQSLLIFLIGNDRRGLIVLVLFYFHGNEIKNSIARNEYSNTIMNLLLLPLKRTKCGHHFGATITLVRPSATPCDRSHLPRCPTGEREKEMRDRKRNCHPCDPHLL